MKTLDEVIAELEDEEVFADALHYLKEYKEKQKTLEIRAAEYKRGFEQLGTEWSRLKDNSPLTWDELKGMEGKPVWVEGISNPPIWLIVWRLDDDTMMASGKSLSGVVFQTHLKKTDVRKWKAYRKERG